MQIIFISTLILSIRLFHKNSYLTKNKTLHPILEDLIKSKCFSNISINMDEPCENQDLAGKCTFKTCIVPRGSISQSKNVCRTGREKNNQCIFEDRATKDEIGVDLVQAKQIHSGYKNNAANIWNEIYNEAKPGTSLYKLISGIHYSITLHIAVFYKYIMCKYWSNPIFYYNRKNFEHYSNLVFAFKVVKYALISLKGANLKCSLELSKSDLEKLLVLKNLIKALEGDLPNDFGLVEYQDQMQVIKKLLNCIECDLCKLWGKIQFNGLETALDIIAGYKQRVTGNELIMLLNLFYKLSSSLIYNEKLDNQIKYRYMYFILLYSIEIFTVIFSLLIFMCVNRRVRKGRIISHAINQKRTMSDNLSTKE